VIVPPTTEQLRAMSATPCQFWINHTNPPAEPPRPSASTCEGCRHFTPDAINPVSGLGFCELRKVSRYPMQLHWCRLREEVTDAAGEA